MAIYYTDKTFTIIWEHLGNVENTHMQIDLVFSNFCRVLWQYNT